MGDHSSPPRISTPSPHGADSDTPPPPKDETEIQVFHPTMDEFKDFTKYIDYMESQGAHHAGIAKIISPEGWRELVGIDYRHMEKQIIRRPSEQRVEGKKGVFTQYNEDNTRKMNVKRYEKLASMKRFRAPVFRKLDNGDNDLDDVERKYWRNVTSTWVPPICGALSSGCLYTNKNVEVWNLKRLGSILDLLERKHKNKINGINKPYLHFGMWRTTSCWQVANMDLYSIHYLHSGQSKVWYAIPPENGDQFEKLAASYFPVGYETCPAFLRHNMTLISPWIVRKNAIPVQKIEQKEREFIVTFPRAYHAGFDTGYNYSESTNFATKRWIDFGKSARLCMCGAKGAVRISMDAYVKEYQSAEEYEEWKMKNDSKIKQKQEPPVKTEGCSTVVRKRHPSADCKKEAKKPRQTVSLVDYDSDDMDDDKASVSTSCSRIPDAPIDN